jgi:RNA polymerase sigma-70 factor (ECF subfamily)
VSSTVIDENIVKQAIKGDQWAFAQIYDQHFDKIYRYVCFKVTNRTEAEDLTQEVFLKALGAISTYKWRQVPFSAWLFRIAHNEVVDYYRRQAKKGTTPLNEDLAVPDEGSCGDPVQMAEGSVQVAELRAALEKISPAQREVITMRFTAELSISEVAKALGKREGTIKALQFGGTKSLKKILAEKLNGQKSG